MHLPPCLLQVNSILEQVCEVRGRERVVISPLNNNVFFAIGQFGLVFSTRSFAKLHIDSYQPKPEDNPRDAEALAASKEDSSNGENSAPRPLFPPSVEIFEQALWGDLWIHPETRKVVDRPPFTVRFVFVSSLPHCLEGLGDPLLSWRGE